MSVVKIDSTGVLVVDGKKVFPIGFSEPPPVGAKASSGRPALDELSVNGGNFVRTGPADFGHGEWGLGQIDAQIAKVKARLDEAAKHGVKCWLYLGTVPNLPPRATGAPPAPKEQLLERIVNAFKGHAALGAYKGFDEPANATPPIGQAGLVRAYKKIRALDPNHPIVIIQAPRKSADALKPYRPAFDVTGVDIFPISNPPTKHSDSANRDLSVVGDMTKKMTAAAGTKPVWTTLQIAWSGVIFHPRAAPKPPPVVPCFPSLDEERLMAYDAIVNGARGLMFFGGHLLQVCRPDDAKLGWNWAFWRRTLRPVVSELASEAVQPALLAPNARDAIAVTGAKDVGLVARRAAGHLYVIAVKRGPSGSRVNFAGLPKRLKAGDVLNEYVQMPAPPPIRNDSQVLRPVTVANGAFSDWFRGHDVHVYRFKL